MVGSLSAGLLLADEAGAHLPSVDDFLPPEILFQGTPFAINRIILIRIVATIVLLVVLGVTAKRAKLRRRSRPLAGRSRVRSRLRARQGRV